MIDNLEIETRFTYHQPKEGQPIKYETVRGVAKVMAKTIINQCPPECRETSLAITHLEQAVMWANAAIARRGA